MLIDASLTSCEVLRSSESKSHNLTMNSTKIFPIRINRRVLPNSQKMRIKFRANGYKNFSKISAAGPDTLQILRNIQGSSCFSFTQKFEFDPYLCDSSCLQELNIILKKLKCIKQLCLILRRFENNGIDQVKKISPNIYKLTRLKKINIEFSSIPNLQEVHLLKFHKTFKKCFSLNSLQWKLIEGPIMSVEYYDSLVKLMKRLTKLENYQEYMTIKKGIPNYSTGYSESFKNPPKFLKIKTLGLYYSAAREWYPQFNERGVIII